MAKEKSDAQKEVEDDIKRYSLLEITEKSEGGQMLLLGFKTDVVGAINKIRGLYKKSTHEELIAWCAILDSRMTLLDAFQRAPKNRKFAVQALTEILKSVDAENGSSG